MGHFPLDLSSPIHKRVQLEKIGPLEPHQVHIHVLETNSAISPDILDRLSKELVRAELTEYRSLDPIEDRKEFLLSRLLVRRLGSYYLGIDRSDLILARTEKGKPLIPDSKLHFNLSHTSGLMACSFGNSPVGIDVEKMTDRDPGRCSIVARRFFSKEEQSYLRENPVCDQTEIFYRIFTLKEARVKAAGEGLGRDLSKFSIPMPLVESFHQEGWDHRSWTLEKGNYGLAQVTANSRRRTLEFLTYHWTEAEFLDSLNDHSMSNPHSSEFYGAWASQGKRVR